MIERDCGDWMLLQSCEGDTCGCGDACVYGFADREDRKANEKWRWVEEDALGFATGR